MTRLEAQFKAALDKAYTRWVSQFTFDQLTRSITSAQGGFIVTAAKNIRCSGDEQERRVSATLTVVKGPNFDKPFTAKYVLTFKANRKPAYKASISEVKNG